MITVHHEDGPICRFCDSKVQTAHPELQKWWKVIKPKFVQMHCSWAFRDKAMQEQFFKDGESSCHFPDSFHNKSDSAGNPCSRAIDLFVIDADGVGRWPPAIYPKIYAFSQEQGLPIFWGVKLRNGNVDADHFQLVDSIVQP